jgi:hypothetical protein
MIVQSIPYPASSGGGVTSNYRYSEDLTTTTESAGAYTDLLSYTSSGLTNGAAHLGIWTVEGDLNSTSPSISARLQIDGVDGLETIQIPKAAANVFSFGGLFMHTPSGSSTFKIRGKQSATSTASFYRKRLTLLELAANEFSSTSITRQTSTSATLASAATLTVNPAVTGDYVALVSFITDISSTSRRCVFQLDDGTTTDGPYTTMSVGSTTLRHSWIMVLPLGSITGGTSKTVTLKFGLNSSGATAGIANIVMCALRMSRFTNSAATRLAADNASNTTSLVSSVTQTFTANSGVHLVIGGWAFDNDLNTAVTEHKLVDGGTDVSAQTEMKFTGGLGAGFTHRIATYSAGSHTNEIKRRTPSGTSTTTISAGAGIVTLQL